ncbi:hypothetical protein Tsubulata_002237, partial [Turnera subulata]
SVAVILGRQYFVKGGKSKWLAALVQIVGFAILIPYYFIMTGRSQRTNTSIGRPSIRTQAMVYTSIGLLVSGGCFLHTVGLQYLPVSTYTLILASQLAFNSLFSFLLNSQKFTPFIVNSLVLLTISSTLLAFNNESANPTGVSKVKYAIGFICAVAASAVYGLVLSLIQFCSKNVIKRQTFKAVMDMIIYQEIVASVVILIGFFASGEWNGLTREMNGYELGKASYAMNLLWTCIMWQVYAIGCVGLIFEVSSLFSNAINVLGLPIVPVVAVFVFHDKLESGKAISMVLAIWGFISYVYHHYVEEQKSKAAGISKPPTLEGQEPKDVNPTQPANVTRQPIVSQTRNYKWWIRISIYVFFVLVAQSVAVILGRLYFVKGGKSKWLATLVQIVGFPILIPYYFIKTGRSQRTNNSTSEPSTRTLAMVSSLFSNSIGVVGLPVVPVLAVFVFHDKIDGVKAISMVLAIWGFVSYVYHHYVDDRKSKAAGISKPPTLEG